jgi:methyl-accepting chemotaxis protein
MSIKSKLTVVLAALSLVILVLGATTYFSLQNVNGQMGSIVADRVVPLQQLKKIADAYAVSIVDNAHKTRSGAHTWEEGLAASRAAATLINKEWTAYLATYLTPEESKLADGAKAAMEIAAPELVKLDEIYAARDMQALDVFVTTELYQIIDPIGDAVSGLIDLQGRVAVETYAASQSVFGMIMILLLALAAVSVAAIGSASVVILRTVAARLAGMEKALVTVAGGDFTITIPSAGDRDEIGRIATAAETFRQNGMKVAELTEAEHARALNDIEARRKMMEELREAFGTVVDASIAGDFSRRVPANFPDDELNALATSVNALVDTVDRGITETGTVLSALAETNLTRRVHGQYEGAFARLKDDVNGVADRLSEIVLRLRSTSSSVKTATGEILTGANDLAERTTRQAAAIEETSAAMEQLAGTVVENAKRADNANSKSRLVAETADETGTVMADANAAMEQISNSSGKISNIIGMIDDIAFQTNLLALNASVEAARAGDAGKGFAVVAVEVRRLAQSAAQASSEVKTLIEQSATHVASGSRLVADATARLDSMMSGVRENLALIEAIAAASREQSSAIVEVTTAVRQMDEMTQHNAALVEETNAAIEQTEAQASELDRIVEVFTLAEQAGSKGASAPVVGLSNTARAKSTHTAPTKSPEPSPAAKAYLSRGNAAVDKDWNEF